jgi:hypothetical protein
MINNLKMGYHKLKFYSGVNWSKTLYFNFKKFPYRIAKKLPVFLRKVKFTEISGEIEITALLEKV